MNRYTRLYRNGIYRSRSGIILGVCKGLADHFDFSVFWTRMIAIILLIVAGFFPAIGLYLLAALLMKPQPVIPIKNSAEKEFYGSYTYSRQGAVQRLKRRYENLQRRIQRMEHIVTSAEYDWEKRLNG
ncbi:MAG: PspC domain-containing protein [Desulfobacterales bacterium]|nr:PspC domain-containing protein [Desulfobacterales bacterium]